MKPSAKPAARCIGCRAGRCTTRRKSRGRVLPTIMLFVQSLRGLSHAKEEDTREDHLALWGAVQAP